MFAVYTYGASATQANVKADILAILTGTTSVGSLSASCVTASSSITTTYTTAGWSSYDTSAFTNGFAIRALQQDGVTYKYVGIDVTSSTVLTLHVYESFNSGTHTGTNDISRTSAITLSAGGTLLIYAEQAQIIILAASGTFPLNCMEFDNTAGNIISGYPTTCQLSGFFGGTAPRIKNPSASGDLTTTSAFICGADTNADTTNNLNRGRLYRNASEVTCMQLQTPFMWQTTTQAATQYGLMNKLLGGAVFGSGVINASNKDTVVIGATTYIQIYTAGTSAQNGNIWVPNG